MTVSPKGLRPIHFVLGMVFALLVATLVYQPVRSLSAPQPLYVPRSFYVSRNGSNADGLSWNTAWNELNRINWAVVQPGDTILVDGGSTACPALGPGYNCGMTYNSTLDIGKSGTSGAPITIRLASESGRNGTVIIDGGINNWTSCAEYAAEDTPPSTANGAGVRDSGIDLNNAQWVVIDGTKWGGIEIRNHKRYGLNLGSSQRSLARYLKIHHNTDPADTTNNSVGITQGWQSQYDTVSRVEVFRNGQDAVRGGGDFFTFEESYIHDQYCNHPDGIQSFVPTSNADVPDNAGEVRGLIVRRNVFDRIGMQTIFLGENGSHNSWNIDVTIHDNLFLNNDYVIKSKHGSSRNWNIYNNTIFNARDFAMEWCCSSPGAQAPMTVQNNIIVNAKPGNTAFYMPTGGSTAFTANCLYNTGTRTGNYTETGTVTGDPRFINSSLGNFGLATGTACSGKGASITSVNALLSLSGGVQPTQPAQPTNPPPTATRTTVAPTATRTTVAPTATRTSVAPTATRTSVAPTATRTNVPAATATNRAPTPTRAAPTATVVPTSVSRSVTFRPVADVYADAGQPVTNMGLSNIIRSVVSPEQRTYLRFSVTGAAGQPVTRALLRVYANGSSSIGFQVQRVSNTSWTETGLTFNNKPALNGVIANSGAHGGSAWVTVDVTSYITGDGSYNLAMTTTSTKPVSYPSDESGSNGPQLVVEFGNLATSQAPATSTAVVPSATPVQPTVTALPATATWVPPTATNAVPSTPATLTFGPAADGYVDANEPNENFGAAENVRTGARPEQRAYLRFDVTGVAGRPVTKALLRIYANGSSRSGFVLHKVTDNSWTESALTFSNKPSTNGQIGTSGAHNHGVWITIDITGYITGDGSYSLALLTASTKAVSYPSREGAANPPQLVLTVGGN